MYETRQGFLNALVPAMLANGAPQVSLAFGAIVSRRELRLVCWANVWDGRLKLTEPDRGRTRSTSRQWVTYAAVTLFLLAAVVVTGALASHSRDAWWQKYLSLIVKS